MIWAIGLESLRSFYNKISDDVRERIPSVMVRNREQFNPSDSKTSLSTTTKEKFLKGIATAAALLASVAPLSACGESYSEPTPDTTSTSQETQDLTPSVEETSSPSPEAREIPEIEGLDNLLDSLDNSRLFR